MAVIGIFAATRGGGWAGTIRTLTIGVKVRLVPNDNRENEKAPAFRVFAGRAELGAAWQEHTGGDNPRGYLSVRLDDPNFTEPLVAAMFEAPDGKEAQLVWSRRRG